MKIRSSAVIVLTISTFCSQKQKAIDNKSIPSSTVEERLISSQTYLRDTSVNGVQLIFERLDKKKYDSLTAFKVETTMALERFDQLVRKVDSCQIIKLQRGFDSLCNKRDKSGYFQRYEIKGLWKGKGQLLVNFQDWESSDDYLVNLKSGLHYYLNTTYKISPSTNFILGYNDHNIIPLYGNDFMYSGIAKDSIRTYFNIDFGPIVITNLKWLNDNQSLIASALQFNDSREFKLKDYQYYLMTIKK